MLLKCRYCLEVKYMFVIQAHLLFCNYSYMQLSSQFTICWYLPAHLTIWCFLLRSYKHYPYIMTLNVFCQYQLYPEMHAVIGALLILIKVTESPVKSKHKSPLYYIRVSICVGFFFRQFIFGVTVLPLQGLELRGHFVAFTSCISNQK